MSCHGIRRIRGGCVWTGVDALYRTHPYILTHIYSLICTHPYMLIHCLPEPDSSCRARHLPSFPSSLLPFLPPSLPPTHSYLTSLPPTHLTSLPPTHISHLSHTLISSILCPIDTPSVSSSTIKAVSGIGGRGEYEWSTEQRRV